MTDSRPTRTYFGVDLAWGEGNENRAANETGLVQLAQGGRVLEAGWARGIPAVVGWLAERARPGDVIAIDAPLVVLNETSMRECEREVAQRYMRWGVGANATNLSRAWQGGVTLRIELEKLGFVYAGDAPPSSDQHVSMFECYPYTTLVGAQEFGYDEERPRYKRFDPNLPSIQEKRAYRATECDELLARMSSFQSASPAIDLSSHTITAELIGAPSPLADVPYKHREDLLDAAISAWTAALWTEYGFDRCQVLGAHSPVDDAGRRATIIAPARPEQRRDAPHEADGPAETPVLLDEVTIAPETEAELLVLPDPDSAITRRYLELNHFVGADLSPARHALDLAIERFKVSSVDTTIPFFIDSAVMSYCRAFTSSVVRKPLGEVISIPTHLTGVHERIREYRNTVVAHSQSALTMTLPLVLHRPDEPRVAWPVTVTQPIPYGLLLEFSELIDTVTDAVEARIAEVHTELDSELAAAIPLNESGLELTHAHVREFTANTKRKADGREYTLYWSPESSLPPRASGD